MRIDVTSDLHIHNPDSIHPIFFSNPGDVLVIAGDVAPFCYYNDLMSFFNQVSKTWKTTLVIPGNHEFYGESYFLGQTKIRNFFRDNFNNIFYIDQGEKMINGILFIGTILWSDMQRNNPAVKMGCKFGLNDYNYISWDKYAKNSLLKITPEDTIALFDECVEFIEASLVLRKSDKVVLITHHSPLYQSIAEQYKNNILNGGFASDLEYIIYKYPTIKMWIHGHVHSVFDYKIDDCRVVCNPKGYPGENKGPYKPYRVEI